ncbi:MAG: hypothetical protein JRN20_17550, partial [Nitrososphaerota archaeon]|nr:hypothetical protein [Nitrososphaerota archaeon]
MLDDTIELDSSELVEQQIKFGITRISDGQLRWQDFIRPFSESISGLKSGADLSRWYDTNSFYRKPSVAKRIIPPKDSSFLLNYASKSALDLVDSKDKVRKLRISIPGPYTLASLVSNEFYSTKTELVEEFAKMLKKVILGLPKLGYSSVQINEPSLVYRYGVSALSNKKELKTFTSSYEENLSNLPL